MRSDSGTAFTLLRPRRRFGLAAAALWLWPWILACNPGAAAAPARPAIEVETLRVGFSEGNRGNLFKLGKWTPLWVQLRAGAERFSGVMEVVVPDDDGTPTALRQVVDVPPGQGARFTSYARPGTNNPEFLLRLYDRGGRRVASVSGDALVNLDPIRPEEMLLLALGNPQGVDLVPKLPGFEAEKDRPEAREVTVARLDALSGMVPGRWLGYDAVEAVVLDTNDRALMTRLNASGGQALRDWVKRGGHLVVAVGSDWSRVRDSFLLAPDDPMLPALPTGQERVNDLAALESFAGANKPITPPGGAPVLVTKLEEVEERKGKVLIGAAGTVPLVVRGPYGFGRVTVVAVDVDQAPFATWEDRPLFWVRALDLRRQTGEDEDPNAGIGGAGGGRIYRTGVNDLATQLRQALEQFRGVTLIPFGWVAFAIFLYILLIGPGDYLLLKKVFKRMELTWITFPTIVVTVSALAYYAAYLVKGNELRINQMEVVDVDQTRPAAMARGSTFLTLFSPQNRAYDLSVIPLPLDREPPPEPGDNESESDTPPRPAAGTEVVLSWFGVPGPGFGGMGGNGQLQLSGGGYAYEPPGSTEALSGVRVPIWSTRSFNARWFGPGPESKLIESDLVPVGSDRLGGTLTNRLSVPLDDAILAFGKQVYSLGTIAPGATLKVELTQDRTLSGYLKANMGRYVPEQPWLPETQISRPDLLTALMFHDSGATATQTNPVASIPLHYLDLTGQLLLDRPMLVARIARPAARLVLGPSARPPRIERTTMLRVILPLRSAEGEEEDGARTAAPSAAER